ncbi:MAG: COX15/CtaA family protein [Tuberibacillus sp.]
MEKNPQPKRIFGLAATSAVGLFIVIVMGFIDTITASTMGCGKEWPLCQGGLVPKHWTPEATIEYMHRIIVFVVIISLLLTCILAFKKYRKWIEIKLFIGLGIFAVFAEAGLGALSVLTKQSPYVLAFHMGAALTALTSSVLLAVVIRQIETGKVGRQLRKATPLYLSRWAKFDMVYVFIAIYYGAYVTHSGYGAIFRGWPIPQESIQQGLLIDIGHRVLAMGLFVVMAHFVYQSFKIKSERPDLFFGSLTALVLTVLQMFSGAYVLASNVSIPAFLVHVSIASLIFVSNAFILLQTSKEPTRSLTSVSKSGSGKAVGKQNLKVAHHAPK